MPQSLHHRTKTSSRFSGHCPKQCTVLYYNITKVTCWYVGEKQKIERTKLFRSHARSLAPDRNIQKISRCTLRACRQRRLYISFIILLYRYNTQLYVQYVYVRYTQHSCVNKLNSTSRPTEHISSKFVIVSKVVIFSGKDGVRL